jgi:hypothetical protein
MLHNPESHARTWLRGFACPRRHVAFLPSNQRAGLFGGD